MTPTATYIAEENCLQELPRMEAPQMQDYAWYYQFDEAYDAYNAHVATLRKIPCDSSCKGLWADQQKVVEGVDYEVRSALLRDEKYPFLAPTEKPFAFPLVPVKSKDELWREVFGIMHGRFNAGDSLADIIRDVDRKYSLTKR